MSNMCGLPKKITYDDEKIVVNYLIYLNNCKNGNATYLENIWKPTLYDVISLGVNNEYSIRYILNKLIELNIVDLIDFDFKNLGVLRSFTIKNYLEKIISLNIPVYEEEYLSDKKYFSKEFCQFCNKVLDLNIRQPVKNDFKLLEEKFPTIPSEYLGRNKIVRLLLKIIRKFTN